MLSAEQAARAFSEALARTTYANTEATEEYEKILDCHGCGQQVGISDNTGQCEWCGRRYAEEGDNGKM